MTHTPGPWHTRPEIDGMAAVEQRHTRVFDSQGMQVASTFNQTRPHQQYTFAAAEANARLIAAAPEMLSLLKRLWEWDHVIPLGAEMATTIAKAEGRQP